MKKFFSILCLLFLVACSTHQHCDQQGHCEDDEIVANDVSAYPTGNVRETSVEDSADGDSGQ